MSKALAKAGSLSPEIRLAQAVSEFEADLSSEQKSAFRTLKSQTLLATPTPSDVMRLTAEVDRHMSNKFSSRCFGPRFTNFLQAVQQFAALGDVVVGGSQNLIACGVWSLVRMSILSFVSVSNHVEKLSSIFMDIGRSCPRHQEIAVLYPLSKMLQVYILEYFIVVVALCRYLLRFGQKSALQQFTSSLSGGELKAFQYDLEKWAHSIEKEVQVSEFQQSSGFRALSRSLFDSALYQQKLAAKKQVLDLCSTYDYETVWKQTRKVGNTSLFTRFDKYREWKDSLQTCTIVFTGKLGSGKSVLLANIVDDLSLSTERDRPLVAYFFCRHDLPESLQARTILGSLVRQMLRSIADFDKLSDVCQDRHTTEDVDKILEIVLQAYPPTYKTFLVVDGLDECSEGEIATLVQAVRAIQAKLKVFICASFRVEPNKGLQSMTRRLLDARIVQLPESNPDIETFIEAELYRCLDEDLLNIRDSTLILDIQESLLQRSQGMFLWAALQIQSLCSMKTDHAIREALADLPKDLAQTFSRILHKSGASDPSLQAKILEVVLAACRPLTTEELREALSVDPGHAVWDPSKMLNDVQSALACCGCLLTVDEEESTVRVIHHSVKQYILHGLDDVKYMGFSVGRAHGTLADIIVTYLGYGVFETQLERNHAHPILAQAVPSTVMRNTVGGSSSARQLAMKLLKSKKQPAFDLSKTVAEARGHSYSEPQDGFKFFGYANTNWQNHIPYVTSRADAICELATTLIRSRYPELETTNADSDLYWSFAATTHQDTRILELLMLQSQKMKLCAQKTLVLLVRTGDKDTIKVLLNAGVDANSNRDGAPPIIVLAASNGDSIMIKFLLSFSTVDVNAGDWFGDTAVKKAVEVENEHIIKLLLSSDRIDVNVKNNIGNTVLLQAIDTGNAGIIKLLINDDKIDVNAQSNSGSTALLKAVKYGDEKIVRLLLGIRNIDVNARDIDGKTALMHATCKRNKDMMKLLLGSKSVDVNIKDDTGRTALLDAASKGYSDVVKLMLTSKNIEVNTADNTGWTPLMYAAFHGKIEVVRLLLTSRKIDVNVKGQYHVTALTLAVSKSHQDVVELLVLSRH